MRLHHTHQAAFPRTEAHLVEEAIVILFDMNRDATTGNRPPSGSKKASRSRSCRVALATSLLVFIPTISQPAFAQPPETPAAQDAQPATPSVTEQLLERLRKIDRQNQRDRGSYDRVPEQPTLIEPAVPIDLGSSEMEQPKVEPNKSYPDTAPIVAPPIDQVLRPVEPAKEVSLPKVVDGRFVLPTLAAVSTSTDDIGNGSLPKQDQTSLSSDAIPLPESAAERGEALDWGWSIAQWDAQDTFSSPRYFEDQMLERHGHERWGRLQPLASGIRFFSATAALPYNMTLRRPFSREYTLGYYRPGSAAPALYQRPPWDRRAAAVQSAAIATGILSLP